MASSLVNRHPPTCPLFTLPPVHSTQARSAYTCLLHPGAWHVHSIQGHGTCTCPQHPGAWRVHSTQAHGAFTMPPRWTHPSCPHEALMTPHSDFTEKNVGGLVRRSPCSGHGEHEVKTAFTAATPLQRQSARGRRASSSGC
eukprot:365516-Chlamydomonas_euryale.AAC.10